MSSLVTGGAGFLGSHVAEELLRLGHRVVVLDDLSAGRRENVPVGAELVVGSILDEVLLRRLFREHAVARVFHLAAYAAEAMSHQIRSFIYTVNTVGSARLISSAIEHRVRSFVFTSSAAVYGHLSQGADESVTPQPIDPYGISKYAIELDLECAHSTYGLNYTIFRPHNIYGERQCISDRSRNVVAIFMSQAMSGQPFSIVGDGSQERCFTYVRDIAPLIAAAPETASAAGRIVNLGHDTSTSISELARLVSELFGRPLDLVHRPPRPEARTVQVSHARMREIFGSRPVTPLGSGLAQMSAWVRQQCPLPPPLVPSPEVEFPPKPPLS